MAEINVVQNKSNTITAFAVIHKGGGKFQAMKYSIRDEIVEKEEVLEEGDKWEARHGLKIAIGKYWLSLDE